MNLDEAIAQLIELGEKDPLDIFRKIEQRHGIEWLTAELASMRETLVSEIARQRLGAMRRTSVAHIRPGNAMTAAELKTRVVWIPNLLAPGVGGHQVMANCTAEQFDDRAHYLQKLAGAIVVQADWFVELAERMRAEGVRTFKQFKGELPMLAGRELEAVA